VSSELATTGEEERRRGKEGGATVATAVILNRHAEVGDGRWGGAMWQARAKGEGAREKGSQPTGGRRPTGSGPRPAGTGGVARPCHASGRTGEGGRGLTGGLRPQCQAAVPADRLFKQDLNHILNSKVSNKFKL
jgi:hypothetical protein